MPKVAIVDFGMGNLYSVERACEKAGLEALVTRDPLDVDRAQAVILPGVGAFGDAMAFLKERGLDRALCRAADSDKPVMGVCLGLQLFMKESCVFGRDEGLGLIPGSVIKFETFQGEKEPLRVPHIGWAQVWPLGVDPMFLGVTPGERMYFIHSFRVVLEDSRVEAASSVYEGIKFCAAVRWRNIFGCQFHPERSGPTGLKMYRNFLHAVDAASAPTVTEGAIL